MRVQSAEDDRCTRTCQWLQLLRVRPRAWANDGH